jgi:hypothetical protein
MNALPALTIISAPKPFTNPHIAAIQRNAIASWRELGGGVEVALVGDEPGLAEAARNAGVRHFPQVRRNASGTPLVSSIFELGRQANQGAILAYVNADILLLPDFLAAARRVAGLKERFLIVGQPFDLAVEGELDFNPGWQERLRERNSRSGRLHPPGGSDYFIFPRQCFEKVPDFAIGRAGWDNWMIYEARYRGWAVVDATGEVSIIHQDHDYSHLPDGKPHYRLPESADNVRLGGGERTIFGLVDADARLVGGLVRPARLGWKKFWREVEIFPLVRLHSFRLAQVFYALFHPVRAYREFRTRLRKRS